MTTHPRRVLFLGTHGQYNIGDELLLETFLTQLGAEHHYVVNSYDPDFTARQLGGRFDVEVLDTGHGRRRLLREIFRCDVLVFGGGSIVKELYASTGRNRYATLLMILAIVTVARLVARTPIAMLNVGVGPLHSRRGLALARLVLRQVDLLTVRDERSALTSRQVGARPVLATDAVFAAGPEWLLGGPRPSEDVTPSAPALGAGPDQPLRVGLNLNFDVEDPSGWEPFLAQLAVALQRLHVHHPVELHGLPMQAGFKDHDDVAVIDDFVRRVPGIPFVRHVPRTHVDAARVVAGCDVVVSERLHAIVVAAILGVPVFALEYDVKVRELTKVLGIQRWSLDINRPFRGEDLAEDLVALAGQRSAVAAHLRGRCADLRQEAQGNVAAARAWLEQ